MSPGVPDIGVLKFKSFEFHEGTPMPSLTWRGKDAVLNHHLEVPYRLLHCEPELSLGGPGSGNLIVEGDNLLALKALLPYYKGQVKCIYIDPPYNTGKDWIYNDNVDSPEIREWIGKVVGDEKEDLNRHDKWLCMMLPRLQLLKQFLSQDGLIFVSVDENEHRHLRLLMDDLFGVNNHIETLIWKKSYGGGSKSKYVVNLHEYIECYALNLDWLEPIQLPPNPEVLKYYKHKDDKYNIRGPYRLQPLATKSMDSRPNLKYPILHKGEEIWPPKQWLWSQERVEKAIQNDEIVIEKTKSGYSVNYKQYLKNEEGTERGSKPFSVIENMFTQQGTAEIKDILGDGKAFSFPKPTGLIDHLLKYVVGPEDTVLDGFAGSGTTAHSVLKMNAEDGGNRKFILVEMDKTISRSVTVERVRRVVRGYTNAKGEEILGLKGGFRLCTLGDALFNGEGQLNGGVSFDALARHLYFTEFGEPLPSRELGQQPLGEGSFIGAFGDCALHLLFKPGRATLLDRAALKALPPFAGERVVFADGCSVPEAALAAAGVRFRQIPYDVRG